LGDSVVVAHHAPFDLGFLAVEFERAELELPQGFVFCSSLLARKAVVETQNHRLQTLAQYLGLPLMNAHRALDDARACLEVALHCMNKIGEGVSLSKIIEFQERPLRWADYSVAHYLKHEVVSKILYAIYENLTVDIVYQ